MSFRSDRLIVSDPAEAAIRHMKETAQTFDALRAWWCHPGIQRRLKEFSVEQRARVAKAYGEYQVNLAMKR